MNLGELIAKWESWAVFAIALFISAEVWGLTTAFISAGLCAMVAIFKFIGQL